MFCSISKICCLPARWVVRKKGGRKRKRVPVLKEEETRKSKRAKFRGLVKDKKEPVQYKFVPSISATSSGAQKIGVEYSTGKISKYGFHLLAGFFLSSAMYQ
jgi:hypothetical protein